MTFTTATGTKISNLTKTEYQILTALHSNRKSTVFTGYNLRSNTHITKFYDNEICLNGWRQVKAARKLAKKGLIKFDDRSSIYRNGMSVQADSCGIVTAI